MELPPVAALVTHRVEDYDAWKRVFDAHQPARRAASAIGHDVNRGADDPNMVYVYCVATDVKKLRTFVESDDLRQVMTKAGVQGPPSTWLMKPMSADFIPDEKLPGIVVIHRARDYAKWRVAYDAFDDHRKRVGIVGHAVNQVMDDSKDVIVYHQAKEMKTLRALVASAELKEAMQRGGVEGVPKIHFIQCVDIVEY